MNVYLIAAMWTGVGGSIIFVGGFMISKWVEFWFYLSDGAWWGFMIASSPLWLALYLIVLVVTASILA